MTLKSLNTLVCISLFSVNAVMDQKRRERRYSVHRGDGLISVYKNKESVFIPIIKGKPCIHVDCDCLALYFLM